MALGNILSVLVLANALSYVLSCGGGSPPPACSWTECRNEWRNDWSPGIPSGQCIEQTHRAHQTYNSHQGSGSCPTPVPCNPLSLQYRLACKEDTDLFFTPRMYYVDEYRFLRKYGKRKIESFQSVVAGIF